MNVEVKRTGHFGLALFICGLAAIFYGYEDTLRVLPGTIAQYLLADGHFNAASLGLMSSFFYLGYAPMQMPVGFLLDRFGPRRCLIWATLICGLATLCFAISSQLWLLSGSRFCIGVAASLAYLACSVLIARWFGSRWFVVILGFVQLIGCLGAVMGQWPVAKLLEHWTWHAVVVALAVVCFVLCLSYIIFLRDSPEQRVITHHPEIKSWWHSFTSVIHQSQTWCLGAYIFFIWAPISIFAVLWGIPFFHASYHMSNTEAALLLSFVWVGIGVGGPLAGWFSNACHSRCVPMVMGAIAGVVATSIIVYDLGLRYPVLLACCVLMGMASSVQTVSFGSVFDRQPQHLLGTAAGFQNMCCVAGGFLLQPLVGVLLMHGGHHVRSAGVRVYTAGDFQHALWLLPLCYALAGLLAWLLVKETHSEPRMAS